MASASPLTIAEEKELIIRAKNGDTKAKYRLFLANLRFVISEVKPYRGHGLEWDELVVEGMFGYEDTLRKFDVTKNVRFITFAHWDVRNAVLKALNRCGYRIGQTDKAQRNTIKVKKFLSQNCGESLTMQEKLQSAAAELNISVKEVEGLLEENLTHQSLDALIEESDGSSLHSLLSDEDAVSPEDYAINECMKSQMFRELRKLPPVEQDLLALYYDLDNTGKKYNFAELGPKFGKTKQWACLKLHQAEEHLERRMSGLAA